jgi:RNA polymerase sigma-70 factor (ECF subfamily)
VVSLLGTAPTRNAVAIQDRSDGRVRAPDDARMRELYLAHGKALHRFLRSVSFGARQSAEDLVQETLLRAWRNLDHLAEDVTTLRPWLFTVARRIAIDSVRARQSRPTEAGLVDLSFMPEDDDPIERLGTVQEVRAALRQLPEGHRQVLAEINYRGRSVTETAYALGIPAGTVKSRTFNALRMLRTVVNAGREE